MENIFCTRREVWKSEKGNQEITEIEEERKEMMVHI